MKTNKKLSLEPILEDTRRLKKDFNDLLANSPYKITYGAIEITPSKYPNLSDFIELTGDIYQNMFHESDKKTPHVYLCNYDWANGWFLPNPKSIEEKLKEESIASNPEIGSIEKIEHSYMGKPSAFISSHTEDPKDILFFIAHELAHWADYMFLNVENFLDYTYGDDQSKDFMNRLRVEIPGEILRKQYIHILSDKELEVANCIRSPSSETERILYKQDVKIITDFGYSSTKIVQGKESFRKFIKQVSNHIPLTGFLKCVFEGIDMPEIEEKYGREFKKICEGDAYECLIRLNPFLRGQKIYSKEKLLLKMGFMLDGENQKDEIIKKISEGLDELNKEYCSFTLDVVVNIISYLLPDQFVMPKEKFQQMKKRFNEEDCYDLVREIYSSKGNQVV